MCAYVEEISLGSKRVSGVEEKAVEGGNDLSIFVLLVFVNTASFCMGCFLVSGCWLPWFECVMDPKDPCVTAVIFIL